MRIELLNPAFSSGKALKSFFSPKYRGKVLGVEVAEAAEEIIRNLSLENKALPKKHRFPQLKEWCPGHLWAPSCYHGSVGHGWEVVERYISGQKGLEKTDVIRVERGEEGGERYSYEKADTVPVAVIDEEKEKAHKNWYITLYNKLFGGGHQKSKKSKSFYIPMSYTLILV